MKMIKSIILLAAIFNMLACQGQKEVVREVVHEPAAPPVNENNNSRSQGGVDDGGGGNGINNRPLETFATPLYKIAEFNSRLLPLIEKIYKVHPRFASDMAHIALNRVWYLIPIELKKIPAFLIGTGFGDAKLQQMALQNLNSVYINSIIFEKMTEENRGTLLLHEIVMGIHLMKYKSPLDQCYSAIAMMRLLPDKNEEYQKLKDECALKYGLSATDEATGLTGASVHIDLKTEDYDNIRELVILLSSDQEISKVQLDAWLKDKKFRTY
ncbi:MAG: hypothetical protein ACXVCY_02390 [Pseudobdellovibrionaceae bacterium]